MPRGLSAQDKKVLQNKLVWSLVAVDIPEVFKMRVKNINNLLLQNVGVFVPLLRFLDYYKIMNKKTLPGISNI